MQNGDLIIQNTKNFCYGIDAVLLAGFARVKPGERVLDMGTGTGIIPILLKAKTPGEHFTGLEIHRKESAQRPGAVWYTTGWRRTLRSVREISGEAAAIFGRASFCGYRQFALHEQAAMAW